MNQDKPLSKTISPDALVCIDAHAVDMPLRVDLAYARDDNLLFGERIYKRDAKLWLYEDLAKVVLGAAERVHVAMGGTLVVYDGLRVLEAQAAMLKTQRVQENPQWLEEPRLLSPPGAGGHPRGMAVDVSVMDAKGVLLDMGCAFDFLSDDPAPAVNPAHRDFAHRDEVIENRSLLDEAMMGAAADCGVELVGLAQEWWDYRLPQDVYGAYTPIKDADLPAHMRIMD